MYDLHPGRQISKGLANRHYIVTPWKHVGPLRPAPTKLPARLTSSSCPCRPERRSEYDSVRAFRRLCPLDGYAQELVRRVSRRLSPHSHHVLLLRRQRRDRSGRTLFPKGHDQAHADRGGGHCLLAGAALVDEDGRGRGLRRAPDLRQPPRRLPAARIPLLTSGFFFPLGRSPGARPRCQVPSPTPSRRPTWWRPFS